MVHKLRLFNHLGERKDTMLFENFENAELIAVTLAKEFGYIREGNDFLDKGKVVRIQLEKQKKL